MSTTSKRSYEDLCAEARAHIAEISTIDLRADFSGARLLIDLREPNELASGVLPNALSVPRGRLEKVITTLQPAPEQQIVLYCATGGRSALAAATLMAMGYDNVVSLAGGISAWIADGGQVVAYKLADAAETAGSVDPKRVDCNDWCSIRAAFPITETRVACADSIERPLAYFDHAATTHPPSTALKAHAKFLGHEYANVHRATHRLARAATARFDAAFGICADFIGGNLDSDCIVFTANTTHACDLVAHVMEQVPGKVLITEMEHHSNDLPFRKRGDVVRIGLREDLTIDLDALENALENEQIKLVSVCGAANITGWIAPIHQIARLAHAHGALICVDAAQLLAHAPVDVRAPDDPEHIDFLTAAGHKMYAPFGVGFLYGPRKVLDAAPPYIPGGGTARLVEHDRVEWLPSPDRHHGGTPNVGGVVALASVIKLLSEIGMDRIREHELVLMRRAWKGFATIEGVQIYGPTCMEDRVGILPFNIAGVSDLLCSAVLGEEAAIAVRNGRFCAHGHASVLLQRQGGATLEAEVPSGAVRAAFGIFNTEAEVDRLIDAVRMVAEKRWVGTYTVKGGDVTSASAGRCADAWMETES